MGKDSVVYYVGHYDLRSKGIHTFSYRGSFVRSQYFYGSQIIVKKLRQRTDTILRLSWAITTVTLALEIKLQIVMYFIIVFTNDLMTINNIYINYTRPTCILVFGALWRCSLRQLSRRPWEPWRTVWILLSYRPYPNSRSLNRVSCISLLYSLQIVPVGT